jgi:hypothetical protein
MCSLANERRLHLSVVGNGQRRPNFGSSSDTSQLSLSWVRFDAAHGHFLALVGLPLLPSSLNPRR